MVDNNLSNGAPSGPGSRPTGRASKAVSPVPASIPSAAWCVMCGGHFTEEEISGRTSCPKCGNAGVPCDPSKDATIDINWHELRILCMWAANWAEKVCKERDRAGHNSTLTIQAIARRIRSQLPGFGPLTMQDELVGLRQEFGEVDAVGIGPSAPLPVNGPGAMSGIADDLLTATIMLFADGERHVVELSFASHEESQRACDWLGRIASAIEARSDATGTGAAEGESAGPKGDAQPPSGDPQ